MIRLEDMRVFAKVAEAHSFTGAGRLLDMPKQTVSRRVAELEAALGSQLLHRTTRRLFLTEVGEAYAARCAELVRLADEANSGATADRLAPQGVLRVTADTVFGEAFLAALIAEYVGRYPGVRVEVLLTARRVELAEEGLDLAIRVGRLPDSSLTARRLCPASVRYCASPGYLEAHGLPKTPDDLRRHECITLGPDGGPVGWPFKGPGGDTRVPVSGRVAVNNFALAHQAALLGLGITTFPAFACEDDIRAGRLVPVLDDWLADHGAVFLVFAGNRHLAPKIRAFVDLAVEWFRKEAPWQTPRGQVSPRAL